MIRPTHQRPSSHRCVCAFAPRARSTWDRSVAVAAVAVNLVKFPVARRRRRRCRSAVPYTRHHRYHRHSPFTITTAAPPPPPTRDSKRYRPPRATIKTATKNYRHRSPFEFRVRFFFFQRRRSKRTRRTLCRRLSFGFCRIAVNAVIQEYL